MRQTKLDEKKRYVGDTTSIARFDLPTGKMQTLIEKASSSTISPDGKQLAAIRLDQMRPVLVLANADGQDARIIAKTEPMFDVLAAPQWSPDGTRLLFTAAGGPRPAGRAPSPALSLIEWALGIRVAAAHGAPADIWVIDASGQNPTNLTKKLLDDPRGAWSPDSKQILFTAGQAGGVYLLDPATTQAKQLTTQGDFGGIDWASR
jgi:Tol biopolymer transport system component